MTWATMWLWICLAMSWAALVGTVAKWNKSYRKVWRHLSMSPSMWLPAVSRQVSTNRPVPAHIPRSISARIKVRFHIPLASIDLHYLHLQTVFKVNLRWLFFGKSTYLFTFSRLQIVALAFDYLQRHWRRITGELELSSRQTAHQVQVDVPVSMRTMWSRVQVFPFVWWAHQNASH